MLSLISNCSELKHSETLKGNISLTKDCSLGMVTVSSFTAERFIFSGHWITVKNRLHNVFHIKLGLPFKRFWEKNTVFSSFISTTRLKCWLRKLLFTCYELCYTEIVFFQSDEKKQHNIGRQKLNTTKALFNHIFYI